MSPTLKRQLLAPEIAEQCETPMTLEAYERRMAVPPTDEEVEELADLVRCWAVSDRERAVRVHPAKVCGVDEEPTDAD